MAIFRLVDLALSCVAMPTSKRPSMTDVITTLEAVKKEVYGVEVPKVQQVVDERLQERTDSFPISLAEEMRNMCLSSKSSTSGSSVKKGSFDSV